MASEPPEPGRPDGESAPREGTTGPGRVAALSAAALTFSYRPGRPVLTEVSVDLRPGELTVIIGPNGAAKSTLLRLLAGLRSPDSGDVWLGGRALSELDPSERARRIAFVPQAATVPFAYSAKEVVLMGRHPFRAGRLRESADDHARAEEALAEVDAGRFRDRAFNELSGGEKQRVVIARALCQSAGVLLLDEPTSAQDLAHGLLMFEVLERRVARGELVAVATHDVIAAGRFADRVLVLSEGRAVACGPPAEVLTEALFGQVFGVGGRLVELDPTAPEGPRRVFLPTRRRTET